MERSYVGLKLLGASSPNNLGKMSNRPQSLERDKRIFDIGIGALPKILEAYMGEAALSTDPTQNIIGNFLWIVIMLFWQHNDKYNNGLPWMEVHINHWLPT